MRGHCSPATIDISRSRQAASTIPELCGSSRIRSLVFVRILSHRVGGRAWPARLMQWTDWDRSERRIYNSRDYHIPGPIANGSESAVCRPCGLYFTHYLTNSLCKRRLVRHPGVRCLLFRASP
ncbi:uncharacterized protein [Physcomitrium patens]|uniref:uncharacterized protein n=1 Tax=Physcomitrium patens TaxID=3218 RepID=UPI003CCDD46D